MPLALVKIVKEYAGEEYENVWCVGTGANDDTGFTELDWNGYTGGMTVTDANTDYTADGDALKDGDSIIHSLIAFERFLSFTPVQFKRLIAWDGQENGLLSTFATLPLNFYGLRPLPDGEEKNMAAGGITWLINKTANVFGRRAGRIYLRLSLAESEVRAGGKALLDWEDSLKAAVAATRLNAGVLESGLDKFMNDGSNAASSQLMIPRYSPRVAGVPGSGGILTSGAPVKALSSQRPNLRQVKRGRKRSSEGN